MQSLFCALTVTKLASDYLLAAYHMFLMFVIHFRKTHHLKQLSVFTLKQEFTKVQNCKCYFGVLASMLVLNQGAVGWRMISEWYGIGLVLGTYSTIKAGLVVVPPPPWC